MTLPLPTLDHVVVNVRNRMDEAVAQFRRLGFTMTPRGYHTLGSMNHLAVFGTDYMELIGAETGNEQRRDILEWPIGLNGVVFGTEDSAGVYESLAAAGVPIRTPTEFSRPVALPGDTRDAVFRTVRLPHESFPAGRLYFCHHLTRDLVWRDEWRTHPNGAIGVARAVIAARDPAQPAELLRRMFGAASVHAVDGGYRLAIGLADFAILAPSRITERYGNAAPDGGGRDTWMAGLVVRTRDQRGCETALRAGGIDGVRVSPAGIVVPASAAFDTLIEFVP